MGATLTMKKNIQLWGQVKVGLGCNAHIALDVLLEGKMLFLNEFDKKD